MLFRSSSTRGSPLSAPVDEIIKNVNVHRWEITHFPLRKLVLYGLSIVPNWQVKCLFHPYQMLIPSLWLKSLTEKGYDVVHATASPFTSLLYMGHKFAKTSKAPFILTPFIHLGEENDQIVRREHIHQHQLKLLRKADALLVQTKSEGDFIAQCGVPKENIYYVGVGVNPQELAGGDGKRFRRRYSIADEEQIIGHIARLDVHKGTVQLLDALQILLENNRPVKVVLLGKPTPDFKKILDDVPDIVKRQCLMFEYLGEEEKKDLLDAMNIFVMPSRVETFGIVYLESWLYKKPVIGAEISATREVISHGNDGFLVKFGDAQGLAEKIMFLIDHPEVAQKMGENGYHKTICSHVWDMKCDLIKSIYCETISRCSAKNEA